MNRHGVDGVKAKGTDCRMTSNALFRRRMLMAVFMGVCATVIRGNAASAEEDKTIMNALNLTGTAEVTISGARERPWIRLQWKEPVKVSRLVLRDRTSIGKILFSNGRTLDVNGIPVGGKRFESMAVNWLRLDVFRGKIPGSPEIEVYSDGGEMPAPAPRDFPRPWTVVTIAGRDPRIVTVDGVLKGPWGGAMWCPFAGTNVSLVANTGPECGMADLYIDGIWQKTANWFSEKPAKDVTVFSAKDLPDGRHLLGILTRSAKQPESKGTLVNWSRIEYTAGAHPERFVPVRRARFDPNVPLWLDNQGEPIQGHLGGILFHEGKYYWLGMDFRGEHLPGFPFNWGKNLGFAVYSSTDLMNWTYHGNSCGPGNDPDHPLYNYTRMVARVRPLRAAGTGKFVALFQLVGNPFGDVQKVDMNATAVAVSDKPEGPYQWHGILQCSGQPVQGADTAVFTDDDGRQYLITAHSGTKGWNVSEWLYELAPDCLSVVKEKNLGTGGEAPALFKHDGVYYLLHSHLTALAPNENFYHTATNIWGPWQAKGKMAQGENSDKTFMTQTMDVVPVAGKKGAFIWIGDSIRNTMHPCMRTVWLPVTLRNKGEMEIRWRDSWNLAVFGD
jgi:hypothetical protein